MPASIRHVFRLFSFGLLTLIVSACSTTHYYSQLVKGHLAVLRAREPVDRIIADSRRDPGLRRQLQVARDARRFASEALYLPDNRSYRLYADIKRPYVVWNVFATAELSLAAVQHCFPVAGCVAYRGYYKKADAIAAAARQHDSGDDVYVAGVQAYSTLGWFADPILSSMMQWSTERLVGTIFHELAHQKQYVRDDTLFNESFATFVEQEGVRQWRIARHLPPDPGDEEHRRRQFVALVMDCRERLHDLYRSALPDAVKRERKAAEFRRLRQEYETLVKQDWHGVSPYAAWMESPFNNAKLLPFGLYDQGVPGFAALFRQTAGNWPVFYARVRRLADLPIAQRHARLTALAASLPEDTINNTERP